MLGAEIRDGSYFGNMLGAGLGVNNPDIFYGGQFTFNLETGSPGQAVTGILGFEIGATYNYHVIVVPSTQGAYAGRWAICNNVVHIPICTLGVGENGVYADPSSWSGTRDIQGNFVVPLDYNPADEDWMLCTMAGSPGDTATCTFLIWRA